MPIYHGDSTGAGADGRGGGVDVGGIRPQPSDASGWAHHPR